MAVSESVDMNLVGAVSRTHKGRSLKDVLADTDLVVKISGSVAEALDTPTDVLVDYQRRRGESQCHDRNKKRRSCCYRFVGVV